MVGGQDSNFPSAQEILGHMGKNVVYCGPVGTGQAAKICNNMLLAISMIGTAETMNLGIRCVIVKFIVYRLDPLDKGIRDFPSCKIVGTLGIIIFTIAS